MLELTLIPGRRHDRSSACGHRSRWSDGTGAESLRCVEQDCEDEGVNGKIQVMYMDKRDLSRFGVVGTYLFGSFGVAFAVSGLVGWRLVYIVMVNMLLRYCCDILGMKDIIRPIRTVPSVLSRIVNGT